MQWKRQNTDGELNDIAEAASDPAAVTQTVIITVT